jgi:hypothetical protein
MLSNNAYIVDNKDNPEVLRLERDHLEFKLKKLFWYEKHGPLAQDIINQIDDINNLLDE